ncbi:MAG TPA: hypothetical protein VL051_07395 [Burkholderiaceae bacterium]|nr:hypothetical protein [Burkholderiaceae bacterium]
MVGKREFRLTNGLPPQTGTMPAEPIAPSTPATPSPLATPSPNPPAPPLPTTDGATETPPTPYFNPAAWSAGDYPPSWYETAARPAGRYARTLWLACIFSIGAASGAAALWWANDPARAQRAIASWHSEPAPAAAPAHPDAALNTSPGELPYDGPPREMSHPAATPPAPEPKPEPAAPETLATAPAAPIAGASAISEKMTAAAGTSGAEKLAPAKAPQKTKSRREQRRESAVVVADTAPEDNEKKSNRSGERSLTPLMLAQCASMSDAHERQECKREVCNGKWGKDGCTLPAEGAPVIVGR